MTPDEKRAAMESAVLTHYISTGRPMTIAEIAHATGFSQTVARGIAPDCQRLAYDSVSTPVRERSYNTIIRYRQTAAYVPTRRYLIDTINDLRAQLHIDNTPDD